MGGRWLNRALVRDFLLIPVPFSALAIAFFVAGVPQGGVVMGLAAAAALWFMRPHRSRRGGGAGEDGGGAA